jgi:hypothetical protein
MTVAHSARRANVSERKQERARARKLADEAKAAGDDSNLLKIVLSVPEDGGEMAFSGTAEVQAAMQEGEAAFVKEIWMLLWPRMRALSPSILINTTRRCLQATFPSRKRIMSKRTSSSHAPSRSIPTARPRALPALPAAVAHHFTDAPQA